MWKDFFYFSKGQRIGIIVLLVLIVLVVMLNQFFPFSETSEPVMDEEFRTEVRDFKRKLVSIDSINKQKWDEKYRQLYPSDSQKYKANETYVLFNFDPNKVDSSTFVRLGIQPFIASNILKFRNKGGTFKTKESFSKVYGLKPEKYRELEPYIQIEEIAAAAKDIIIPTQKAKTSNIIVELNSADTTQLMQVIGIGRGYAKSIVRFRQQTGGFVSIPQLHELYGMTEANFEKISPFCKIDLSLVQKIRVNTASVDRLKQHPYLSFFQAKAIYELRRNKGKLKTIQELKQLEELSSEDIAKIGPYLNFE